MMKTSLHNKIAAQLYSVRKEFEADPDLTLKNIKEIGFKAIQLDGMRGHTTKEIEKLVKKHNLFVAGMHIKHDRFRTDLDGIIEESYLFGCKTIYDKYIEDEEQHEAGYRETKQFLLSAVQKLSPLGFRIGLHCPEYDYNNLIDGRCVLDYITDPEYGLQIYSEPDTYWMKIAGRNVLDEFKKFSGRCPLVHLKDFKAGFDKLDLQHNITHLGDGEIDFTAIIDWGEHSKVEYYCVEQDYSLIGIFNSLQASFDYLMQMSSARK